jgi:hypothetical protein
VYWTLQNLKDSENQQQKLHHGSIFSADRVYIYLQEVFFFLVLHQAAEDWTKCAIFMEIVKYEMGKDQDSSRSAQKHMVDMHNSVSEACPSEVEGTALQERASLTVQLEQAQLRCDLHGAEKKSLAKELKEQLARERQECQMLKRQVVAQEWQLQNLEEQKRAARSAGKEGQLDCADAVQADQSVMCEVCLDNLALMRLCTLCFLPPGEMKTYVLGPV